MECNYTVPPGAYFEEYLDDNKISHEDGARSMGMSVVDFKNFLDGTTPLTQNVAIRASQISGIPVQSFEILEAGYVEDLPRLGITRGMTSAH